MKICPQCKIEYQDHMKFCPECGSKLEYKPNVCPNCGTKYNEYQKFCFECGKKLEMTSEGNLYQKQFSSEIEELCKKGVEYCDKAQDDSDYEKALFYLNKAAKAGHPKAMFYIGLCYAEGSGLEQDLEKAFSWYLQAAKVDYKAAQMALGDCCYLGDGVDVNYEEAIKWYTKAAEAGDVDALERLGNCFSALDNIPEAIEWYTKAAEAGSITAMESLGDIYSDEGEYDKSEEWYNKSYEAGSTEGIDRLQDLYEEGLWNNNRLMELCIKAVDSGNTEAIEKLGDLYFDKGEYEKAIDSYTQAANDGCVSALSRLGDVYYILGEYENAIKWYDSAISSNVHSLGNCYCKKGDCYFELRNYSQTINCYKEGTKLGEALAFMKLGDLCLLGLGMERNYEEAYNYYILCNDNDKYNILNVYIHRINIFYDKQGRIKENTLKSFDLKFIYKEVMSNRYATIAKKYEIAARNGSPKAQFELAQLFYSGNGVVWDVNNARKWYRKAAAHYEKLAENGDKNAQLIVGDCLCYGETSEGLRAKSHHWYMLAAEAGLSEAQVALGNAYKNGIGSKVHLSKAVIWYEKASQAGNIEAKYTLGKMYSDYIICKELKIKKDFRTTFPLFKYAAEFGHSRAQYELAQYYENGYGITKNMALAYKWYKQSFENGEFDAFQCLEKLKKEYPNICVENQTTYDQSKTESISANTQETENTAIDRCIPNVFFIKAVGFVITYPDGKCQQMTCGSGRDEMPSWTGTGFLLADGRFVTARHVVEAWSFPNGGGELDEGVVALNIVANNGGKVVAKFVAISSNGTQILFTSDQCTINRRSDKVSLTDKGAKLVVAEIDDTDYAYFHTGRTLGLPHNNALSTTLARGAKLVVLGFPLGIGANSANDINPILGSGIVAAPGLQKGVILTTDSNYEQGNSGGPVFKANSNGDLEVIGLVSAGAGNTMGFIVPIAAVK